MDHKSNKEEGDVCDIYAVVDKKKKRHDSQHETADVSDLYAVVDKKKKSHDNKHVKPEVNDLYAVVGKKKKTKQYFEENGSNIFGLYASINKNDKISKKSCQDTTMGKTIEEYSLPVEYSSSQNTVVDKNGSIFCGKSAGPCKRKKAPLYMLHIIWLIVAAILLILAVSFAVSTAIGFTRVSAPPSESPSAANNEIFPTTSISTIHVSITEDITNNEVVPTTSTSTITRSTTEDMTPTTQGISDLLIRSNFSYLTHFFTKKNLSGLLSDCIIREVFSFIQCVNLVLSTYGKNEFLPALSCKELKQFVTNNSGFYWIMRSDGSILNVYCEMTTSCGSISGGLMRIATINLYTRSQYCNGEIKFDNTGCVRNLPLPGCSGILLPVMNLSYSHICGIASGSYFGTVDGFQGSARPSPTINDNYVDGISFTYGSTSNRTHIWTLSAATGNCSIGVPSYVGMNYSCLASNPLMKFHRDFKHTVTEDIEVRLCQDQHRDDDKEGIYLSHLDIYIY